METIVGVPHEEVCDLIMVSKLHPENHWFGAITSIDARPQRIELG